MGVLRNPNYRCTAFAIRDFDNRYDLLSAVSMRLASSTISSNDARKLSISGGAFVRRLSAVLAFRCKLGSPCHRDERARIVRMFHDEVSFNDASGTLCDRIGKR